MSQPMLSKLTHTSPEIKGLCYHHPAKPRVCDPSKTVTRRQSQENQELEAICGYIASSRPTWGKRHYLPPPKAKDQLSLCTRLTANPVSISFLLLDYCFKFLKIVWWWVIIIVVTIIIITFFVVLGRGETLASLKLH